MRVYECVGRCIPYYNKCKELNLVLLTHTGQEYSVDQGYHDDSMGMHVAFHLHIQTHI